MALLGGTSPIFLSQGSDRRDLHATFAMAAGSSGRLRSAGTVVADFWTIAAPPRGKLAKQVDTRFSLAIRKITWRRS